jgi:hypothetical protein
VRENTWGKDTFGLLDANRLGADASASATFLDEEGCPVVGFFSEGRYADPTTVVSDGSSTLLGLGSTPP